MYCLKSALSSARRIVESRRSRSSAESTKGSSALPVGLEELRAGVMAPGDRAEPPPGKLRGEAGTGSFQLAASSMMLSEFCARGGRATVSPTSCKTCEGGRWA